MSQPWLESTNMTVWNSFIKGSGKTGIISSLDSYCWCPMYGFNVSHYDVWLGPVQSTPIPLFGCFLRNKNVLKSPPCALLAIGIDTLTLMTQPMPCQLLTIIGPIGEFPSIFSILSDEMNLTTPFHQCLDNVFCSLENFTCGFLFPASFPAVKLLLWWKFRCALFAWLCR